jgi:hypothetical protein
MLTFQCQDFIDIANNLGSLQAKCNLTKPNESRSEQDRKVDQKGFKTWFSRLEELNLDLTKKQVERTIEALGSPLTNRAFSDLLQEIQNRLRDEIERGRYLLRLSRPPSYLTSLYLARKSEGNLLRRQRTWPNPANVSRLEDILLEYFI